MATVEMTYDDVDTTVTEGVQKVQLALDGAAVEIDLGSANRAKLAEFLAPFFNAGRTVEVAVSPKAEASVPVRAPRKAAEKANGTVKVKAERSSTPKVTTDRAATALYNEKVREWAAGQGIELNERGRIPNEVKVRYEAAHPLALAS